MQTDYIMIIIRVDYKNPPVPTVLLQELRDMVASICTNRYDNNKGKLTITFSRKSHNSSITGFLRVQ